MAKGKYEASGRRRAKGPNWLAVFLCFAVLALVATAVVILGRTDQKTESGQSSVPGTSFTDTQSSQSTTETEEFTTESTTEFTTESTEETTEAATESTEEIPPEYNETVGSSIVAVVQSVIGKPYAYGGTGPDSFDTTGLIYYCFRQCEILAPRGLDEQFAYGTEVAKEFLQPGDVVFFYLETPGAAEYVGIYMGNDTFVAVSSSRNVVEQRDMANPYFAERFVGARRYE